MYLEDFFFLIHVFKLNTFFCSYHMVYVITFNLSGIWHGSTPAVRNVFMHLLQEHLAWNILYRLGKTENRDLFAILFDWMYLQHRSTFDFMNHFHLGFVNLKIFRFLMSWHEYVIAQSYSSQNALSTQSTCTLLGGSVWHKKDIDLVPNMLFPSVPVFWCSQLILSVTEWVGDLDTEFLYSMCTLKPKLTALCITPCLISMIV